MLAVRQGVKNHSNVRFVRASALDLLIHNPELRRPSAARERQRIQGQYLWPEIARSIEKA